MTLEKNQLKNIRNRIITYIRTVPPQKLVELAVYCKVRVPDEIIKKYSRKGTE